MCSPMTCGYPRVKDAHAQVKSPYYRAEASHGAHIGDKATVVCQKGYHMVTNASSSRPQTIDHVGLVCNEDGIWVNPFPYRCYNASMLAKLELAETGSVRLSGRAVSDLNVTADPPLYIQLFLRKGSCKQNVPCGVVVRRRAAFY